MTFIDISGGFGTPAESAMIGQAAKLTLAHLAVPDGSSLSIVVTGDEQIQELNKQYRDVNAPTDVLSFPAGYLDPENGSTYLGDIIISYPRAAYQAGRGGHTVEDELQLLTIHGILHLLGYDHAEPDEKAQMWAAQTDVLAQLGISFQGISD